MNKILKIVRNRNGQAIVTSELGRSVGGGISIVSAIVSGAILWPCLASAQNFSDLTNNAATTTELTLAGKSLQSTVTVLSSSTASTTNALSTRATAIESSATALSTATSVSVDALTTRASTIESTATVVSAATNSSVTSLSTRATAIESSATALSTATSVSVTSLSTRASVIEQKTASIVRDTVGVATTKIEETSGANSGKLSISSSGVSLLQTNEKGNTHGLTVTPGNTTLSGGVNSTEMQLNDAGVNFRNMQTNEPVKVTGVARGVNDFDAVNFQQLKEVYGAIADTAAITQIPSPLPGRNHSFGIGIGSYKNFNSMALGYKGQYKSISINAATSFGSKRSAVTSVGVGFSW